MDSEKRLELVKNSALKTEVNKILSKAKKDRDVLSVILFGSHATGKEKSFSDVDICLVLKPKIHDNLPMTNKRLAYLSLVSEKFDIQIFQQLPLFIRSRILKEGKILLDKDYNSLFNIALSTIKEFELFSRHYYSILEGVKHESKGRVKWI